MCRMELIQNMMNPGILQLKLIFLSSALINDSKLLKMHLAKAQSFI